MMNKIVKYPKTKNKIKPTKSFSIEIDIKMIQTIKNLTRNISVVIFLPNFLLHLDQQISQMSSHKFLIFTFLCFPYITCTHVQLETDERKPAAY